MIDNISGGATADMVTRNIRAKIDKFQGYEEDISSQEIP